MPSIAFPKSQLGPIVDVSITPSKGSATEMAAAQRPILGAHSLKMLVDTGSDMTAVEETALDQMGLFYVRAVWVRTMNGTKPGRAYEIDLSIGGSHKIEALQVVGRREAFEGTPYSGLLGRDVLDQSRFVYDGPAHKCALEFQAAGAAISSSKQT